MMVAIGEIWEFVGRTTKPSPFVFHRVLRANLRTEAGPDSWVMGRSDGHICYMHHNARVAGDWVRCEYAETEEEAEDVSEKHIKCGNKLLQDIANGLLEWELYGEKTIDRFHVEFVTQNETYDFTLVQALDALANDKHCDDRGDWSVALKARVVVL